MKSSDTVNLFFACDDGYIPFLAVTLISIKKNRDRARDYNIRVLNTGISDNHKERIFSSVAEYGFNIEFVDITEKVEEISDRLHTRDYYSKSTYYRLFIPELYPTLDKALYLDCDIVVLGDISELYDTDLGDNLVGGVSDGFVLHTKRLHGYVTNRIGVEKPEDYFNAGVLLMNLKEMRRIDFGKKFVDLISQVTFKVAQDQDYLNTLCKSRALSIDKKWNCMPDFNDSDGGDMLIHYNLDRKPWQRDGIEFSDIFWRYCALTSYLSEIEERKANFSAARKASEVTVSLIDIAEAEGLDEIGNERIREALVKIGMV